MEIKNLTKTFKKITFYANFLHQHQALKLSIMLKKLLKINYLYQ